MNKKKIEAEADPHAEDFAVFMEEFLVDSDRASVVLGAAKIDALLCSLLDHYLIPNPGTEDDLLEGDLPLGTFSARIKMCHRLGLIDAHFAKLLHVFRRLRNAFGSKRRAMPRHLVEPNRPWSPSQPQSLPPQLANFWSA